MPDATGKISTACPDCGTIYRVRPEGVGRKAKCQCGTVFTVRDIPEPGQGYELAGGAAVGEAGVYQPATPGWSVPPMVGGMVGGMAGVMCMNHATVPAARRCGKCGQGVCATCGFSFPNGVYLCPTCATDTRVTLSTKRKVMAWFSIGLAIWTTLVFLVLVSGLLRGLVTNKEDLMVVGCFVMLLGWLPCLAGAILGFSALDRRRGNTPLIWIGAIANLVLIGIWILLRIL